MTNDEIYEYRRVRYFYDFEKTTTVNVSVEITVKNVGKKDLSNILLPLEGFKPYLHVYDTDSETLEFREYADDPRYILVDLPVSRKVPPDSYRTLKMCYVRDTPQEERRETISHDISEDYEMFGKIVRVIGIGETVFNDEVRLSSTATTYVYVKFCKEYEPFIKYQVVDCDYNLLERETSELVTNSDPLNFHHIQSNVDNETHKLVLRIIHKVPNSYIKWNVISILIGAMSIILIPLTFLFMFHKSTAVANVQGYVAESLPQSGFSNIIAFVAILVTWAIFIVTSLIIIKGWLIQKELNDELVKIYDLVFKVLTLGSTVEIVCIVLWLVIS